MAGNSVQVSFAAAHLGADHGPLRSPKSKDAFVSIALVSEIAAVGAFLWTCKQHRRNGRISPAKRFQAHMSEIQLHKMDLNLLTTFEALVEVGSVGRLSVLCEQGSVEAFLRGEGSHRASPDGGETGEPAKSTL